MFPSEILKLKVEPRSLRGNQAVCLHFNERERKFITEIENVVCMLRPLWKSGPEEWGYSWPFVI